MAAAVPLIKVTDDADAFGVRRPYRETHAVNALELDSMGAEELEGAHKAGIATVAVNYEPGAIADYYARSLVGLLEVPIFKKLHP